MTNQARFGAILCSQCVEKAACVANATNDSGARVPSPKQCYARWHKFLIVELLRRKGPLGVLGSFAAGVSSVISLFSVTLLSTDQISCFLGILTRPHLELEEESMHMEEDTRAET